MTADTEKEMPAPEASEESEGSEAPQAEDLGPLAPQSGGVADAPLEDTGEGSKPLDLEFLLDIPLQVTVEIGRTRMLINDLLQLGQGSVIELQKLVGEPFEVFVNEKLIARGEIVVVNDRFGVRLTDIISPMERIQQLG